MSILVLLLLGGWTEAETLRVDAAQGEQAYPIWIQAGDTVTFSVSGTWSMWHPNWSAVDFRGHLDFRRVSDHHLGALLGRIGDGQPQPIFDGLSCTSVRSGWLVLYPNRERYTHLAARGALRVEVSGGTRATEEQAREIFFGAFPETQGIVVGSDQPPAPLPLWVREGDTLRFKIAGSWRMIEKLKPVGCAGHEEVEPFNGFPLGALIGAVEGRDPFLVTEELRYACPRSGRLLLYPNRAGYLHYEPSGSLWVAVRGAEPVSHDEAERRHGWDIRKLDTGRATAYLSELEKDVLLYLNKARHDPPLFAELYLYPVRETSAAAKECYRQMRSTSSLPVLAPTRALHRAAADHAEDTGRAGITGHVGTDGSTLSERVERHSRSHGPVAENCDYGRADALSIVLALLIDDGVPSRGHRKNILWREARCVGVAFREHATMGHICVQDFASAVAEKE